jgi:hypothetical protein
MRDVKPNTRKGRILNVLKDRKWHLGCHREFGDDYHTLSQRVGELGREHGCDIITRPHRPPCKACHMNGCRECNGTGVLSSKLVEYRLIHPV